MVIKNITTIRILFMLNQKSKDMKGKGLKESRFTADCVSVGGKTIYAAGVKQKPSKKASTKKG